MAKALLIIPLPCDGHFFCQLINATAQAWEVAHPGQVMTTAHMETREGSDGKTVIIWDEPVPVAAPADFPFTTHPLTCNGGNPDWRTHHDHEVVMERTDSGLRCPECGRVQEMPGGDTGS